MLGYVIRATVNSGENKHLHRTTFDWTPSISSARIIEDKEKAEMLFNKLLGGEIELIDSLLNVLDEHPFW